MRQQEDQDMIRWLPCRNDSSSEEIPAYAAVRPAGVDEDGTLVVAKPNADDQWVYIVGPEPIPAGSHGRCTADAPIFALYDSGDGTPAADEDWGAENGSYKLAKDNTGFVIQGGEDSDSETVYVRRFL
jgi:hypothetical protein